MLGARMIVPVMIIPVTIIPVTIIPHSIIRVSRALLLTRFPAIV